MVTERWEIDASHSGIHFSVRHLVIAKVRGQFSRWSGAIVVPDGDFARASVEAVIERRASRRAWPIVTPT